MMTEIREPIGITQQFYAGRMLEKGAGIIQYPRRFDELALRGRRHAVRDIARILNWMTEFREHCADRAKKVQGRLSHDITI
jgi:hypothetical protein